MNSNESNLEREDKLRLEMFTELSNPNSKFKEFVDRQFGKDTFTRFTVSELLSDYKKFKRSVLFH